MSHWGYVMEQILQGDERTGEAQRHHRQRRGSDVAHQRWRLAKHRTAPPPDVIPVRTSVEASTEVVCARAAALARGALA